MDVSVVIPFYNNVNWLYEAVNSINETNDLVYEIIIINDGSDELIEASKFSINNKKVRVIDQPNQGPGKARNTGIDQAAGEYIAFLDSDDLFLKDKLSKQLKFMKDNDLNWSHTSYKKFYDNGNQELVDNSDYFGMVFPYCFAFNPIATPTVMVKRDALENPMKRFSESMRFGQDNFMWSQLAANFSVGVISEPLTLVRMRGNNTALKAISHLYTKSHMFNYMRQSDKYYNGRKIPIFLKIVFSIADFNYKIVKSIFVSKTNNSYAELFCRVLYSTQYYLLKLYRIKSKNQTRVRPLRRKY